MAAINSLLQSPPPVYVAPTQLPHHHMDHQALPPPAPGTVNMLPPMENLLLPPGMMGANNSLGHDPSRCENYSQPPPRNNHNNNNSFLIPDLSRPPPGFGAPGTMQDGGPPAQQTMQLAVAQAPPPMIIEPVPATPYFDLPAGLMAPFIRLEDCSYKALDPAEIVLPPPTPPSDRLLMAVESFYSLPSHDRPRDGDGWEKLALYEYYKVKNQAKKQKEEAIHKGLRERSRTPSPIAIEPRAKKVNKRRYRSESRSPDKSSSNAAAVAATPPPRPAKVSTPTPVLEVDEDRGSRSRSRDSGGSGGGGGRGSRQTRERRSDSPAYESSRLERGSRGGRPRDISPPTAVVG